MTDDARHDGASWLVSGSQVNPLPGPLPRGEGVRLSRAFTLIELLAVVIIVGVLAGVAVPQMATSFQRSQLREASGKLLGAVRYAQVAAVTQRREVRLVFLADVDADEPGEQLGYRLEIETVEDVMERSTTPGSSAPPREIEPTDTGFELLRRGPIKPTVIPERVMLEPLMVNALRGGDGGGGGGDSINGGQMIRFYPDASSDAAVIRLTDGRVTYSVVISSYGGQSKLVDEAIDQVPIDVEDLDA